MTIHCDYCHKLLKAPKPGQRFCSAPATCRQSWHREQHLPGVISNVRQLKNGGWSISIRYANQPAVRIGERVSVEIDRKRRPDASRQENG